MHSMDGNRNTSGSEGKASALPLRDIHAVRTLIGQKVELPSPPGIVVRILEAVQNDDQCFANLGRIVAADPALAVKLLKVANSSMYGCNGKVQSIESALTILGISALKNIALTFIIVRTMHSDADGFFDFKYFWKRAVTAAVAARTLAQQVGQDSDTLFVSALLLFLIQPMVGKMILPSLGGTPAVWNTCMMFFQAVLRNSNMVSKHKFQRMGIQIVLSL